MTAFTVRRARPADSKRVRELDTAAMSTTPEWVPDAPDDDLANLGSHYLDPAGHEFLVAVRDGTVVGTGAYKPLEDWKTEHVPDGGEGGKEDGREDDVAVDETAELTRMRVAPDHWGEGVGDALYESLESRARAAGYHAFALDTGVENERARGFYESLGFTCLDHVTVEFGELQLNLVVYHTRI